MSRVFSTKPSQWEVSNYMGIKQGVEFAEHNGFLPNTPIWEKLEQRHEARPLNFQIYHPNIAAFLDRWNVGCDPIQTCDPICPPPCDTPHTICHDTPPDCLTPYSVPEPAALVSMAIGVVLVAAWAMRRR